MTVNYQKCHEFSEKQDLALLPTRPTEDITTKKHTGVTNDINYGCIREFG